MVLAAAPAAEARRLALLIGNQAYTREVGLLSNPIKDVELVAASLKQIGFAEGDIAIIRNADRTAILEAVDTYADRLAQSGDEAVGFFYYSGHGAANNRDRRNYLIPVGVGRFDRRVWYNAVALDDITGKLNTRAPNAAHFVIFDACRNVLNAPAKGAKGFVPAQRLRGMLIAFSTEPGEIASDEGPNSGPYAAALAAELTTPGLHHLDLFQNVKERVYRKTGVQVPWTRNGMLQRVFLAGESKPEPPLSKAARAFQIARETNSPAALRAFARRYKDTVFADMALAVANDIGEKPPVKLEKPRTRGTSFRDCDDVCPEMVFVPAGNFMMGSRKVTIPRPFAVGKFEVTFAEWDACVAADGCSHKPDDAGWGRGRRPVMRVSWNDTQEYIAWLSKKTGHTYRLLTEAEWEYAARAGTTTPYHTGDTITKQQAQYGGNIFLGVWGGQTVEVGSFSPNAFGLHDMHGNVWEWVNDWYGAYESGPQTDPQGPNTGRIRVFRGGSWYGNAWLLRSADRYRSRPDFRSSYFGFRLARTYN